MSDDSAFERPGLLRLPSEHNLQIRQASSTTVGRAKGLRQKSTPAEALLWERLRNRNLEGLKFRRQCPLGKFIVDFFCAERGLVIELDGTHHYDNDQRIFDQQRTEYLEADGYLVLRFSNVEVQQNVSAVCEAIERAAQFSNRQEPLSREGEGQE